EMFQDLWPRLPVSEVPITSVTNGVHTPTWINGDLAGLYDQYLQPDWRERLEEARMWELVHEIPNQELWRCIASAGVEWWHLCGSARSIRRRNGRPPRRKYDACRRFWIRTSLRLASPGASLLTSAPLCSSGMLTGSRKF